jgi:hypothetical protein
MKNRFASASVVLLLGLCLLSIGRAQTAGGQGQPSATTGRGQGQAPAAAAPMSPWKFYPRDRAVGDGGPAPKRDLTGSWAGPSSGMAVPRGTNAQEPTAPPLTPLGQQLFSMNKPIGKFSPAGTNDPHTRYCDPFGFPQNMTNEIRGMTVANVPGRTLILLEYMTIWREIWTDGRPLPTNAGAPGKDSLDPTYNGYSVGHWDDDYTFVVDTTGIDDATWTAKNGYPHTINAVVHERYHRDSKNDLTLTITMDDPKLYTKTFELGVEHFRWIPNQKLAEFSCIPSQVQEYLQTMGDPAGNDPGAVDRGESQGPAGRGRGGRGGQPQQ